MFCASQIQDLAVVNKTFQGYHLGYKTIPEQLLFAQGNSNGQEKMFLTCSNAHIIKFEIVDLLVMVYK